MATTRSTPTSSTPSARSTRSTRPARSGGATLWSTPTARGRGVAVLGVLLLAGGLGWHYPVLAGLGACLVALVLAEVVAVLLTGSVVLARDVQPRTVVRGSPCEGVLTVHGRRRRGLVRLEATDLVGGASVPVPLPDGAEAAEGASVRYPIPTPRRGLVDVGPLRLRRAGLTGMAHRLSTTGEVVQVRVLPRRVPLGGMMRGHRRAAAGGDDSLELGGTDLVGLHEYVVGDDLRRLHWATSARSGTLMVREDAEPGEPHVCVLLDDRAASYSDAAGEAQQFEEAVELAAALCRVALAGGHPLRLQTLGSGVEVVVPGSVTGRPRREEQELDWLLTEIALTPRQALERGSRDLDVAVAVSGPAADRRELALGLGTAGTRVLAVVDPSPGVAAQQQAGVLELRATGSAALAALWDEAAGW